MHAQLFVLFNYPHNNYIQWCYTHLISTVLLKVVEESAHISQPKWQYVNIVDVLFNYLYYNKSGYISRHTANNNPNMPIASPRGTSLGPKMFEGWASTQHTRTDLNACLHAHIMTNISFNKHSNFDSTSWALKNLTAFLRSFCWNSHVTVLWYCVVNCVS